MTVTARIVCDDSRAYMASLDANSIDTIITDPPYGLSFMGKGWDRGVPSADFWSGALRVCKPGAMLLAFGGTRTHHRLMCAIEDAGWEIRDCLMWLYGSGFPKSMDISKAIDKSLKAERVVVGKGKGRTGKAVVSHSDIHGDDAYEWPGEFDITAPATDDAKLWNGWGTALKPAWEPIILAMKPLDGTFAANAQRHGVAGLNIDGCRIPTDDNLNGGAYAKNPTDRSQLWGGDAGNSWKRGAAGDFQQPEGRFPANVILDEEAGQQLDEQSGGGGASRFFYCAKAAKSEKGDFNNHPTVKPLKLMEYLCRLTATAAGGVILDPFMGSGTTGVAAANVGRDFIGVEIEQASYEIAARRLGVAA
jgi:hypothetical protein